MATNSSISKLFDAYDSAEAWFYQVIQAYQKYPTSDLVYPAEMLSCLDEEHPLVKLIKPFLK